VEYYNNDALGAKCKYLESMGENCLYEKGSQVRMVGVLFDVDMFWMIESLGKEIIKINKCKWSTPGSKEIKEKPLDPWMGPNVSLCRDLNVNIKDYSATDVTEQRCALLGTGISVGEWRGA
jgi:hypothetical protein